MKNLNLRTEGELQILRRLFHLAKQGVHKWQIRKGHILVTTSETHLHIRVKRNGAHLGTQQMFLCHVVICRTLTPAAHSSKLSSENAAARYRVANHIYTRMGVVSLRRV